MSIFSKSQYTWLASSFRDEVYKIRNDEVKKKILLKIITNIATSLENENPHAFDKSRFLHNIYCAHDHKDNICPYYYNKAQEKIDENIHAYRPDGTKYFS